MFHGTDIGHLYETTGARFLEFLRERGQGDGETYRLALENIEQGRVFYGPLGHDFSVRENMMVDNFIRAFDGLNGECVMGAYGSGHVSFSRHEMESGESATMATQLRQRYGDGLCTAMLWERHPDPLRYDAMTVGDVEFRAAFFSGFDFRMNGFVKGEYWRLEDAYDHFRDNPAIDDVVPFDCYPMPVELGQVFAIRLTGEDGVAQMRYYRSNGRAWRGMDATEGFGV